MGLFSKIKKSVSNIAKNPTDIRSYADIGVQSLTLGQADTRGVNNPVTGKEMSFDDLLLGKKSKDIGPDDVANQIRATQTKGIGELNAALDTPSENIVREQAARQEKGVLASAQDARRNAQRAMAQRGLAGSSLGLGLNRSIDQQAGESVANINAQLPGQIRNQKIQDATTRINVGGVNQNGMNFNTIEGTRSGGLLGIAGALAPLGGTIAGGMMGGPAGAQAGGMAGQGIGSVLAPKPQAQPQQPGAYNPNNYSMGNYQF